MKRRPEGTLERPRALQSAVLDRAGKTQAEIRALVEQVMADGVSSLQDFLEKAGRLAAGEPENSQTLRAELAQSLKRDLKRIGIRLERFAQLADTQLHLTDAQRANIEREIRAALFDAVIAGAAWAHLRIDRKWARTADGRRTQTAALDGKRPGREPKNTPSEIRRVLSRGLTMKEEAKLLKKVSLSTIRNYRKKKKTGSC